MTVMSGIIVQFEKSIRDYMASNFSKIDFSKPQYSLTRIGTGQYDITLNLAGFGTQHFSLSILGDRFDISGKMALVGDNPNFPLSLVASLINSTVAQWITSTTDTLATKGTNSIVQANTAAAAKLVSVGAPATVPLLERIPSVTATK